MCILSMYLETCYNQQYFKREQRGWRGDFLFFDSAYFSFKTWVQFPTPHWVVHNLLYLQPLLVSALTSTPPTHIHLIKYKINLFLYVQKSHSILLHCQTKLSHCQAVSPPSDTQCSGKERSLIVDKFSVNQIQISFKKYMSGEDGTVSFIPFILPFSSCRYCFSTQLELPHGRKQSKTKKGHRDNIMSN